MVHAAKAEKTKKKRCFQTSVRNNHMLRIEVESRQSFNYAIAPLFLVCLGAARGTCSKFQLQVYRYKFKERQVDVQPCMTSHTPAITRAPSGQHCRSMQVLFFFLPHLAVHFFLQFNLKVLEKILHNSPSNSNTWIHFAPKILLYSHSPSYFPIIYHGSKTRFIQQEWEPWRQFPCVTPQVHSIIMCIQLIIFYPQWTRSFTTKSSCLNLHTDK